MNAKTDRLSNEVAGLAAVATRMREQGYGVEHVRRLRGAAEALRDLVNAPVPGESPAQRLQRWGSATEKFRASLDKARTDLVARELAGLASLAEQRQEALGLHPDRYAAEIANAMRGADQQTRIAWLKQAAESADGRTLAAVMEAPAFVTGIDREMLSRFLDSAEAAHAPAVAARRAQFKDDVGAVQSALKAAEIIATRAVDAEALRDAAEAEKAATEAQDRLSEATA